MTLVEFLLARIAEDEAGARAATQGEWHWVGDYPSGPDDTTPCVHGTEWTDHGPDLMAGDTPIGTAFGYDASGFSIERADGDHITRWDPARVLAEGEAKRRVVEAHPVISGDRVLKVDRCGTDFGCETCHCIDPIHADGIVEALGWCETLLALALPYADHPQFQPEWLA